VIVTSGFEAVGHLGSFLHSAEESLTGNLCADMSACPGSFDIAPPASETRCTCPNRTYCVVSAWNGLNGRCRDNTQGAAKVIVALAAPAGVRIFHQNSSCCRWHLSL
jgi:hypothetical protein